VSSSATRSRPSPSPLRGGGVAAGGHAREPAAGLPGRPAPAPRAHACVTSSSGVLAPQPPRVDAPRGGGGPPTDLLRVGQLLGRPLQVRDVGKGDAPLKGGRLARDRGGEMWGAAAALGGGARTGAPEAARARGCPRPRARRTPPATPRLTQKWTGGGEGGEGGAGKGEGGVSVGCERHCCVGRRRRAAARPAGAARVLAAAAAPAPRSRRPRCAHSSWGPPGGSRTLRAATPSPWLGCRAGARPRWRPRRSRPRSAAPPPRRERARALLRCRSALGRPRPSACRPE
jgi:hypothetical protein